MWLKETIRYLIDTIKRHPFYSLFVAFIIYISFHQYEKAQALETPIPHSSSWMYALRGQVEELSGKQKELLIRYMNNYRFYQANMPNITIGEAIKKQEAEDETEAQEKIKQKLKEAEEETAINKAEAEIPKRIGLTFSYMKYPQSNERYLYAKLDNLSKKTVVDVGFSITLYDDHNEKLISEYFLYNDPINPKSYATVLFDPCDYNTVGCKIFESAKNPPLNYHVYMVKYIDGEELLTMTASSFDSLAATTIDSITMQNLLDSLNASSVQQLNGYNFNGSANNSYDPSQSESAQIDDWQQAAQNDQQIINMEDGNN